MTGIEGSGSEGTDRDGQEPLDGKIDGPFITDDTQDLSLGDGEELSLGDEEERLPWLESGEYDDEDGGVDSGRIVGFALLGLLALAALIGGIWYLSNRTTDPELVADGSTIEAPVGPVKEKPEDPGGKTFAGTGNVAPGVGEGETRDGRLAEDAAPKPSIDAATPANTTDTVSGIGVQVGAYSTKESAQKGWDALARQTDAIKGFKYRIVEGKADIGTVYRLQAMAGDQASAKRLCDALKADGLACQVK